jgi:hypothetical protein
MNSAKAELLNVFDGTDNGQLKSFCGIEINIKDGKISLSMEYYWNKLMKKFNVAANEIEDSPIKTKVKRSDCPNHRFYHLWIHTLPFGLSLPSQRDDQSDACTGNTTFRFTYKTSTIHQRNQKLDPKLFQRYNSSLWHGFCILLLCRFSPRRR